MPTAPLPVNWNVHVSVCAIPAKAPNIKSQASEMRIMVNSLHHIALAHLNLRLQPSATPPPAHRCPSPAFQTSPYDTIREMELLIVAILLGLIPAAIAQSKGHNFVVWWLYGAALFIVALPHSLLIKSVKPDAEQMDRERLRAGTARKCPFCAEKNSTSVSNSGRRKYVDGEVTRKKLHTCRQQA